MFKDYLKNTLTPHHYKFIKALSLRILTIPFGWNLKMLAKIYKCDKWGAHHYILHYQKHFKKYKFKSIRLLEIGVGGHSDPFNGGNSLRMWKRYFLFGKIFSIDLFNKKFLEERRIKIFQGSQDDKDFLNKTIDIIGEPDIIIDDGSHINSHVINTFKTLFPKLKDGGIYVIEDTQTSYWPGYKGDTPVTTLEYFKTLTDCLNYQEFYDENYQPGFFDKHIVAMHFYHNLIFIYKGNNDEISNLHSEDRLPEEYNQLN